MTRLAPFALALAVVFALACAGCDSKPEPAPPPAAEAPPPVDREAMMREAAAKIEVEKEKIRESLRAKGTGTVKKKKLLGKTGDRKLELDFEFENKSDKELLIAEGSVEFRDATGAPLKRFKVPFQGIKPGKKTDRTGRFPLDQTSEVDKKLAETDLKDLPTVWFPSRYRFADGEELRAD